MKAIVKKERGVGLWMMDMPEPVPGPNDVLIKVKKTSICGTDVTIYKWEPWAQKNVPIPLIVGHEFVGEIAEVGSHVKGLKVGDRVVGEGHIVCGLCPNCLKGRKHMCSKVRGVGYHRNGCFAEYLTLPAENVFVLPESVSDDLAAIFDPYGNAVHTALSFEVVGEDVLITGAGPIGIMAAAIVKKGGARHVVITDVNDYRLNLAKKTGAHVVNVAKESLADVTKKLGIDWGFTVGLEMSGNPAAFNQLLESMQDGAKIALLGILPPNTAINWDLVIFKMFTLKGIYGREIFSTWFKMVHLLEAGLDISPIITHHFHAHDFQKGFDAMLSSQSGKVILQW
jgi:threonine 3-dehydrogenase